MFFSRKIHPTWLFTALCAAILVGVAGSRWLEPSFFYSASWLFIGIGLTSIAFVKQKRWMILFCVAAGLLIGFYRGSLERHDLSVYQKLIDQKVELTGTVSEDTDIGKNNQIVMRLNNISHKNQRLTGKIWLSSFDERSIKRSDRVTFSSELSPGFGAFSASAYSAQIIRVERTNSGDVALSARDSFADKVRKTIDEPMASLGLGYLVGQRRALPPDLNEALKIAGLTHIIVASGYNLTILVRFARRIFEPISKYLATIVPLLLVVTFIAITGMSPSMSRAGFVTVLALLAWYFGRKFHPGTLLLFAAATTVLVNPSYAWRDLGWELSFAAFAGVMILAPLLQRYFFGNKDPNTIRQILGETISAQIMTAPIIILAFGKISLVAVIANLLILPLVPLAMILTFMAGIGAIFVPAIINVIGFPAELLLNYMVNVATWSASLPWAQLDIKLSVLGLVVCYATLGLFCWWMKRATGYNFRDSNIVE